MVVIEENPSEEDNNRFFLSHESKSKPLSETTKPQNPSSTQNDKSAGEDDSDGFETASESEFDEKREEEEEQSSTQRDESIEATFNNDIESTQKSLEQANDAKLEGNRLFGAGQYKEAMLQYDLSLQVAPDSPLSTEVRSICYANRALCSLKLGKHEETIKDCTKALELKPDYVKALLRRAEAHEKLEHFEEAIADMKKVLELDQSDLQARRTIQRLEPLAAEKREKLKEEMLGKLKEMGNSILGKFGMSTDNFKAVKDPNTGSYSIQFQK